MLTTCHILERLDDLLFTETKRLLHRNLEIVAADKSDKIFQLLFGSNDDTPNNASLGKRKTSNVGHLLLRRLRQKADDRDHTAESDRLDGLLDRA